VKKKAKTNKKRRPLEAEKRESKRERGITISGGGWPKDKNVKGKSGKKDTDQRERRGSKRYR